MTSNRLTGLIQLHVVASAVFTTGYFIVGALAVRYLPLLELSEEVNLLVYSVPIAVGTLLSGRFWRPFRSRFHTVTWIEAASVAARQSLMISLMVFGLIVATKDRNISRLFLATYLLSCWILLIWLNRYLPHLLAKLAFHQAHRIPALLVGSTRGIGKLDSWIKQREHLGITVAGLLSDEPPNESLSQQVRWLGPPGELAGTIEQLGIGQVIVLDIPPEAPTMQRIIETCQSSGCRILVYQDFWERMPLRMVPVIEEGHLFLTTHDEPLEDPFNRGMKRLLDIAVSLPVVVFILPILCLCVFSMQLVQAPGPLFFKRVRGGQRRREFMMLKFRSMYAEEPDPAREARQARPGDPRIYPFGRFLRRTSLDEFPQFWNVLTGKMSVVGPRPHLPTHDDEFSLVAKTYRTRQLVKPGITGLAQVSGYRGEISDQRLLQRRVQLDIYYITNWSVWLDVQIISRTSWQMFRPPKSAV